MKKSMQKISLSLAALLIGAATLPALAQDNTVYIEQRGSGNTLKIDQSGAQNAQVRGLEIVLGGTVTWQEAYTVPVEDTNEVGDPLIIDGVVQMRDEVKYRDVTAPVLSHRAADAALQDGVDNTASVIMTGTGGVARLLQNGSMNEADILISGNGLGVIGQEGIENYAGLDVRGSGRGTILQDGNSNRSSLIVKDGLEGFVSQIGNGNVSGTVSVSGSANLSYVQEGTRLQPITTQGVQVISNSGGTIQINQTGFSVGGQ